MQRTGGGIELTEFLDVGGDIRLHGRHGIVEAIDGPAQLVHLPAEEPERVRPLGGLRSTAREADAKGVGQLVDILELESHSRHHLEGVLRAHSSFVRGLGQVLRLGGHIADHGPCVGPYGGELVASQYQALHGARGTVARRLEQLQALRGHADCPAQVVRVAESVQNLRLIQRHRGLLSRCGQSLQTIGVNGGSDMLCVERCQLTLQECDTGLRGFVP